MGVRVLFDSENAAACLFDSVTDTAFGRVFLGDAAAAKMEGFLKWYAVNGAHRDPRVDPNIGDVQDTWAAKLDHGCDVCCADPWDPCDVDIDDAQHERRSTGCAHDGCKRGGRPRSDGKAWCFAHAPRVGSSGSKVSS